MVPRENKNNASAKFGGTNKEYYGIFQSGLLKRAKVPTNDLVSFYTTCIRPVAEYACPVFHTALPQYLSDQLELLQKRALRIISNNELSYRHALEVFSIPTLYARREAIGNSMFQDICNNNNHKLHSLLPPPYSGTLRTRKNRKFQVPRFKTNRFRDGQYKTQTADCRLQTGYKMQTRYKMQTADCRPGTKCRPSLNK